MRAFTIGHGTRPLAELVETLELAGVRTLVDVRRFPGSRRNPQFNRDALAEGLARTEISYRHAVELGGRRSGEPGEERFACIREAAFRSYAARMGTEAWQEALADALAEPAPCFLCAETLWWLPSPLHRRAPHGPRPPSSPPSAPRRDTAAPAARRGGGARREALSLRRARRVIIENAAR